MKKTIRIISLGLITFLLAVLAFPDSSYKAKIVFEDYVVSRNYAIDEVTEAIVNEDEIALHIALNYEFISQLSFDSSNKTNDEIEQYRMNLFEEGRIYHTTLNNIYAQELNLDQYDEKYISEYSPFIEVNMSKEQFENNSYALLEKLATHRCVDTIYVQKANAELKTQLTNIPLKVQGTNSFNTKGLTGNGIKIGIIEPGIINTKHVNLANTTKTARDVWYYSETVTEHATAMASIIAGTGGLAPKAAIFSVEVSGNPDSEFDWLMSNGVHLVNASYGNTSSFGVYNSHSAYYDYVIEKYLITVVASVGNHGTDHQLVSNPALAYNVISVGASSDLLAQAGYSSFISTTDGPFPNFLTPGSVNVPNMGAYTGTSTSAAVTTGCVALLMELNPELKVLPQAVRTILVSATTPMAYSNYSSLELASGYYSGVGAGHINFDYAVELTETLSYHVSNLMTSGTIYPRNIFSAGLRAGDKIRVTASWLASSTGTVAGTKVPVFYLHMMDYQTETIIFTKVPTGGTTCFFEFTAPYMGIFYADLVRISPAADTAGMKVVISLRKIAI